MQAVDLPIEAAFYPLGYPLRIATNSSKILRAAEESWSRYAKQFSGPELHLRIAVTQDDAAPELKEPTCRAQGHVLINVADRYNFAICDLAQGFGFCSLTSLAAEDTGYTRYHFIEAMVYSMLAHLCVTPLHAGCVARDGRGVLLFGPSGAGKSCLTFACAKRGWTYISDDGTSLVRGLSDLTVLGKPYKIRFRESAADLFPELEGLRGSLSGYGKPSIEVDTTEMPDIATATTCRVERLVFLNRTKSGPARFIPLSKQDALYSLESELPMFEQRVHEDHKASLRALLELPVVTLRYGDLNSAIDQLEALLQK